MTVDESPVSPPTADPTTSSRATVAKKPPHPDQTSTQIPDGRPLPVQQLQQHHQQQQQQPDQDRPITFEVFMQLRPKHAESKLEQLAEISGIKDRAALIRAFNETRVGNYEFNITAAIDWILNLQTEHSKSSSFLPEFGPVGQTRKSNRMSTMSPTVATHTPISAVISESSNTFATGPSGPGGPGVPPSSPNSSIKPLVDLTETSPGGNKDNIDLDLEKAIKLSLEEANRSSAGFGAGGISQEEQDVSRALEASLMENQLGGGKRKRNENWIDPLNPHDRERNGVWPVGLKNVGQTCWFSAVIQSLFYLPAFRSLVLNYRPPASYAALADTDILEDGDSNKKASVLQSPFDDRQRKIIEFMLELRRLFALMVASQRRYVDPSRAVDILRGSIGTNGSASVPANLNNSLGGLSHLGMSDNDQQDVSEFTHIVLEWVEEAFKEPEAVTSSLTSKSGVPEMMDEGSNDQAEKENSEEKDLGSGNNAEKAEKNNNADDDNPMAKLFNGKVLSEGRFQGESFSRHEAFGQWPLQVNSVTHIHDSLENSTAHEFFNVSATGVETDDSGQERWFTQLPHVLFLELSRFHYNTERRVAEKINNRLEFPDSIYMDRYMNTNKEVTRTKREQVRALKENRRLLKDRLDKFTSYGGGNAVTTSGQEASSSPVPNRMSLPEVLQYTLSFAMNGNNATTAATAVPSMSDALLSSPASKSILAASSVMMQVDSPCHSPKMTPASSLSNLTVTSSLPSSSAQTVADQDDCPMEVEGCDEPHHQVPSSVVDIDVPIAQGCDPKSPPISSTTSASDAMAHTTTLERVVDLEHDPAPRSISEVEMRVLQSCLTRWKREVEEDMHNLESSIELIDKAIEEMYDSVEELRRLEFSLHAVMVHEGSIDSGHYWAYVRDHRRKVWLKFNDNTVSEVTWDELLKESVGGHSNTSAYSLVYIDASKPELIMDAEDDVAVCEEAEERMDEGRALETLLKILPEDLSDFVNNDNDAFRQEIINWDKEQLEKQRAALEAAANAKLAKQQQTEPMSTSSDPNDDVQVVQEKLTHTNTHARLSLDLSGKVVKHFESVLHDKGGIAMVSMCTEKTIHHYLNRISKTPEVANQPQSLSGIGKTSNNELAPTDIRLESFLAYLLKNGLPPQSGLVELAALEQFAHPGLESNESIFSTIRKCAEQCLNQKRQRSPDDAKELREWHQIYHWFRRSAHCFVNGMEAFHVHKFDRALDLFTEAYQYTIRVQDTRPGGPLKTLRIGSIVRFLCLVLPEVNFQLIKQFQLGEEIPEVVNSVQQLVVPGLTILQTRANAGNLDSAAHTLEAIRNDWCALLAEAKEDAGTALTEVLTVILDTEVPRQIPVRLSKNGEFVNLNADLKLSLKYREMVSKLQQELTSDSQAHGIQEN